MILYVNLITDKQNKGLFVFDTVFIRTIIWLTLLGSPDNGPDKDSIENKCPLFYISKFLLLDFHKWPLLLITRWVPDVKQDKCLFFRGTCILLHFLLVGVAELQFFLFVNVYYC
jgi:hypothetical protein